MGKTAFMFPGQGSQEPGMAADLFKSDPYFRSLIQLGSDLTGCDLEKLCLKGPDRTLRKAFYLQPLLTAVSLGYLRRLLENGIEADCVLGHSLGEIIALGAGGVIDYETTVTIAAKRGELMDEAASQVDGGLLAVMFVPLDKIEAMLTEEVDPHRVVLANDNAPNQVVLSGDMEALDACADKIRKDRLGRCQKLNVSGPWHSPYLDEARKTYEAWVNPICFDRPHTPIVLNATGKEERHASTIKHLVTWQLTSPVFWRESMERLHEIGVDRLCEIGPGRVLSGLARVNGFKRGSCVYNVNNLRGVERVTREFCDLPGISLPENS